MDAIIDEMRAISQKMIFALPQNSQSPTPAKRPKPSLTRKRIFRQDDRIERIGAQRRKTAKGSPPGERERVNYQEKALAFV